MTTIKQVQAELENVDRAINKLKANIDATKAKLGTQWVGEEFSRTATALEKMSAALTTLETRRVNIGQKEFNELNKSLTTSTAKLQALREEQAKLLSSPQAQSQSLLGNYEKQIAKMEATVKGFKTRISARYDPITGEPNPLAPTKRSAVPSSEEAERIGRAVTEYQERNIAAIRAEEDRYKQLRLEAENILKSKVGLAPTSSSAAYQEMMKARPDLFGVGTRIGGGAFEGPAPATGPKTETAKLQSTEDLLKVKGLETVSAEFKNAVLQAMESLRVSGVNISEVKFMETTTKGFAKLGLSGAKVGENVNEPVNQRRIIDTMGLQGKTIEQVQQLQFRADAKNKELFRLAEAYGFQPEDIRHIRSWGEGGFREAEFRQDRPGMGQYRQSFRVDEAGNANVGVPPKRFQTFGQSVGRDIVELGKWSLAISAIYGPINALSEAVTQLIENEAKLADVSIALDSSVSSTSKTFDDVYASAQRAGESVGGVIDAFGQAYRAAGRITDAGDRYTASIKLLDSSLVLSKLSTLDQAGAIDTLTAALFQAQGTNDSATAAFDNATKILDEWVRVSKVANVDIATLATGVAVLGDSAEAAGLNLQQLNALIATIAETSVAGGKEAANIAKALVGNYQQPEAIKALARLGIAVTDVTGKNREFLEVMQDLASQRQSGLLGDQDLAKVAQQLGGGGVRRGADVAKYIENFGRMQQIVSLQEGASGESAQALATKLDTVQTASTQLGNALTSLVQSLGNEGGLLDVFSTALKLATGLVEALDKVAGAVGKVGPMLLGLGTAALALKLGGSNWSAFVGSSISPMLAGRTSPSMSPEQKFGVYQRQANVSSFLTGTQGQFGGGLGNLGKAAGLAVGVGLPAAQNFMSGDKAEAVGNIIGGAAGFALTSSPIGAVVGSSIAEAFVRTTMTYETQFQDFFAGVTKPPETNKPEEKVGIDTEKLTKQIFEGIGKGSESTGKQRAFWAKQASEFLSTDFWSAKQKGGAFQTEEAAALAILEKDNPKLAAQIKAQSKALGYQTTEFETSGVEQRQKKLALSDEGMLRGFQKTRQDELRGQLITGELKPAEYQRAIGSLSTFTSASTRYMAALVDETLKLPPAFKSTEEAYRDFLEISSSGNEELINQLNSQVAAIEYYQEQLKTWKPGVEIKNLLSGGTFTPESIQEIKDLLDASQKGYQKTIQYGAEQSRLQTYQRNPINVYGSNINPMPEKDLSLLLQETKKYQDIKYQELDPELYDALKASFEDVAFLIEDGGKLLHKTFGEIDQQILAEVQQKLEKEGKISSLDVSGPGFQQVDVSQAQLGQAVTQANNLALNLQKQFGYQPDFSDTIIATNDEQISKQHVDMKMLQYILQQILDTEKKQLEGMYNLPEGATFWVPLTGAWQAKGPSSGGGIPEEWLKDPNLLGGDTTTPPTKPSENYVNNWQDRIAAMKEKQMTNNDFFRNPELSGKIPGHQGQIADFIHNLEALPPTAGADSTSVFEKLSQTLASIGPNIGTALNTAINSMVDHLMTILTGGANVGKSEGRIQDPKGIGIAAAIRGTDAPSAMTKFDIKFSSTTQLMVDGRTLATIIKPYLASDLVKTNESGGTVTRSFVI